MTQEQTLYTFFSRFLPAYPAHDVPDGAAFPYLTYEPKTGFFGDRESLQVILWYYGAGETGPNEKAREIAHALGQGGVMLPCAGGGLWLRRGSPWCLSRSASGLPDLRQRVMNVDVEYITS